MIAERDVTLVPPLPESAALFLRWRGEEAVQAYNPLQEQSLDALRTRLSLTGQDLQSRNIDEYRWFVEYRGEQVGTVALKRLNWPMLCGEIGYHMAEQVHGQGIGTIAAGLLVDKIFRESPLVRLLATVSVENPASRRILEKLGFQLEGTLRQHVIIRGRRVDQWLFGLMKSEWTRLPSALP